MPRSLRRSVLFGVLVGSAVALACKDPPKREAMTEAVAVEATDAIVGPMSTDCCPPEEILEAIHAALSLLDRGEPSSVVDDRLSAARAVPVDGCRLDWTSQVLRRIDDALETRARGDTQWKLLEEELRLELHESVCLPSAAHERWHDRL